MTLNESYVFRVQAVNRFGQGPFVQTKPIELKMRYEVPYAPTCCKVSEVFSTSMAVTWDVPEWDGESEITGYHLESKSKNSIMWTRCNRVSIKHNAYRAGNLQEGLQYVFRVAAENKAGMSEWSELSAPQRAHTPIEAPLNLKVADVSRSSCLLQWQHPKYKKGVVVYVIEMLRHPGTKWTHLVAIAASNLEFNCTELTGGSTYEFRVFSQNAAGDFSLPTPSTGPVMCENDFKPPDIILPTALWDDVKIENHKDFLLEAEIVGLPRPEIEWTYAGKPLPKERRFKVVNSTGKTSLEVKGCKTLDAGKYTVTATNLAGEKSVDIKIVVIGVPGEPTGPVNFTSVSANSVEFNWEAPKVNGGSKILYYIVSKRETSKSTWNVVSRNVTKTTFTATRLTRGNEYQFKIQGVNIYGEGESLLSGQVLAKDNFVVPGEPSNVEVSHITAKSCIITFKGPETDGGSPIEGYLVEKRDKRSHTWLKCNKIDLVKDTKYRVTGLFENTQYLFRVSAKNVVGFGKHSEPSDVIMARDPIVPPGRVYNPRVVSTTKDSISLVWGKPMSDGGSEVCSYMLEMRSMEAGTFDDEIEWTTLTSNISGTSYTVNDVSSENCYFMRVSAMNACGVGQAVEVGGSVVPEDKLQAPEFELDPNMKRTVYVRAGKTVHFKVKIFGSPKPTFKWSRDEVDVADHERVNIEQDGNLLTLTLTKCCREDTGKYSLELENSSGKTKTFVSLQVRDTPGRPENVVVREINTTQAYLSWQAPQYDGGAHVFNYRVDRREVLRQAWYPCVVDCTRLSTLVTGLVKGTSYVFRVCAENEYGLSSHAETTIAKAMEVPTEVNELRITEFGLDWLELAWARPDSDGGSAISHYVVQHSLDTEEKQWTDSETQDRVIKVGGLETKEKYVFRVAAINEMGAGEWCHLGPTSVFEHTIKPEFFLESAVAGKVVNARENSNLLLHIPFFGKPLPEITWYKNGKVIEAMDARIRLKRSADSTTLSIDSVEPGDAGKYGLKMANVAGEKEASFKMNVNGPPGKVRVIQMFDKTVDSICLRWSPPTYLGGCDINSYIIEKRALEGNEWWTTVNPSCARCNVKVLHLKKGVEYIFRIAAENKFGVGEFEESRAVTAEYTFENPDTPPKPKISDITPVSMYVEWDKCAHDGGSEILGYHVEYKDRHSTLWARANKVILPNRHTRVGDLIPGLEYQFRVYAENLAGLSEPSPVSGYFKACIQVQPPTNVRGVDITRSTVTVLWDAPISVDASKVSLYHVEMARADSNHWVRVDDYSGVTDCEFVVKHLLPEDSYKFRVIAKNTAGAMSAPSAPSAVCLCRDDQVRPTIKLNRDVKKELVVEGGSTFRMFAEINGIPPPEVVWSFEGKPLQDDRTFVFIETSKKTSTLVLPELTRNNTGTYKIRAENTLDFAEVSFSLKVLDVPAAPEGPVIASHVTNDKITFKWAAPLDNGGSDVERYIVEYCDVNRVFWTVLDENCQALVATARKLRKNHEYLFRIVAVNQRGSSKPLVSKAIAATLAHKKPHAPGTPEIVSFTHNSVIIKFEEPASDGGSKITGYYVERKLQSGSRWVRCNKTPYNDVQCRVTGLTEGSWYEFRAIAENVVGTSRPSQPSPLVECKLPVTPPSPPSVVRLTDTTYDSATLTWEEPLTDNGGKIIGFLVEAKLFTEDDTEDWVVVTDEPVSRNTYKVRNLINMSEYEMRVRAVNSAGAGDACECMELIRVVDRVEDPEFFVSDDFKMHLAVHAAKELCLKVRFGGKPMPTATWTKSEDDSPMSELAVASTADGEAVLRIPSCVRQDVGKYTVKIENSSGSKKLTFTIKVLATPGPVGKIFCKEVKSNYVMMAWSAPEFDGCSTVTSYTVEKREVTAPRWNKVTSECVRTYQKVTGLEQGRSYMFRVTANNEFGSGESRETPMAIKATQAPSPPIRIDVDDVSFSFFQSLKIVIIYFLLQKYLSISYFYFHDDNRK